MTERKATVQNAHGIHCRPSALILQHTKDYAGTILVSSCNGDADLKSVIALIGLGLTMSTPVTIQVEGPDEERMADELVELFERRFDFPPTSE